MLSILCVLSLFFDVAVWIFFFKVDEYTNIAKEKHGYNTEQVGLMPIIVYQKSNRSVTVEIVTSMSEKGRTVQNAETKTLPPTKVGNFIGLSGHR